ncbi:hypothetical protein ABK040_001047 [Willaertia magna]
MESQDSYTLLVDKCFEFSSEGVAGKPTEIKNLKKKFIGDAKLDDQTLEEVFNSKILEQCELYEAHLLSECLQNIQLSKKAQEQIKEDANRFVNQIESVVRKIEENGFLPNKNDHYDFGLVKTMSKSFDKKKLIFSFIAYPGFGKSLIINSIIGETFVPSGLKTGSGLTAFPIEITYGKSFKIKKQYFSSDEAKKLNIKESEKEESEVTLFEDKKLNSWDDEEVRKKIAEKCEMYLSQKVEESVKKYIVEIPNKLLEKIILRDLPGYGEKEKQLNDYLTSYHLQDADVIMYGISDRFLILNDTITDLWNLVLQYRKQDPPYICFLANARNTETPYYIQTLSEKFSNMFLGKFKNFMDSFLKLDKESENKDDTEKYTGDLFPEFNGKVQFRKHIYSNSGFLVFPDKLKNSKLDLFRSQFDLLVEERKLFKYTQIHNSIDDKLFLILNYCKPYLNRCRKAGTSEGRVLRKVLAYVKEDQKTLKQTIGNLECGIDDENIYEEYDDELVNSYFQPLQSFLDQIITASDYGSIIDEIKTKVKNKKKLQKIKETKTQLKEIISGKMEWLHLELKSKVDTFRKKITDKFFYIKKNHDEYHPWIDKEFTKLKKELLHAVEDLDEVTDKITNISEDKISCGKKLKETILDYIQDIKNKTTTNDQIIIDQFMIPKCFKTTKLTIPIKESEDFEELRKNKGVISNDSFGEALVKESKSRLVLKRKNTTENDNNIINITMDSKEVYIEYKDELQDKINNFSKLSPPDKLIGGDDGSIQRVAPFFITSIPRMEYWRPNILSRDYTNTNIHDICKTDNIPHLIFVVIDPNNVEFYKKLLEQDEVDMNNYYLIVAPDLDGSIGGKRKCIMLFCEYFNIEFYHLLDDDIKELREYCPRYKSILYHQRAALRYFFFSETVLYNELYNYSSDKNTIDQNKQELNNIIKNTGKEIFSIGNNKYKEELMKLVMNDEVREGYVKYPDKLFNLINAYPNEAPEFKKKIENLFSKRKHIGQIGLWNERSSQSNLFDRVHDESKATHFVSTMRTQIVSFYTPACRGIHPISDKALFELPGRNKREEILTKLSKLSKIDKSEDIVIEAYKYGYRFSDTHHVRQLLLHGVGGFEIYCFSFVHQNIYSTIDYSRKAPEIKEVIIEEGINEEETEEEQEIDVEMKDEATDKKRKKENTQSSPSKKKKTRRKVKRSEKN